MNQKLSCNEAFPLAFLRGNSYDSHNMETCVRVVRTEHLQCSLNQNRLAHRVSCHTEHLQCSLNQNRPAHRVSCHTEQSSARGASAEKELSAPHVSTGKRKRKR